MPRRITVLLVAVAGLALVAAAPATAAKKRLRIVGSLVFTPGQSVSDTQRFAPRDLTVAKGDRVVLRNRAKTEDPHTITVVRKRQLPRSFNCSACEQAFVAHEVNEEEETVGKPVVNVGAAGFDQAGDSIFLGGKRVTFRVTADEGDNLNYLCAIHPWMQGRFRVR